MEKTNVFDFELCHRFVIQFFRYNALIYMLLIFLLLPACTRKMSVEEAKQVSVSLSETPFTPPPRRIDDILSILDQAGKPDTEVIEKNIAIANAPPPYTENSLRLMKFYLKNYQKLNNCNYLE